MTHAYDPNGGDGEDPNTWLVLGVVGLWMIICFAHALLKGG